jgi:hypothetical protein
MKLDEELAKYVETQFAPLGWHGSRDYAKRCIDFWRGEYGADVADRVASRVRKILQDRRPGAAGKGRRIAQKEGQPEVDQVGGGEEGEEEHRDTGVELEGQR